jgi:nitric oxide reductase large subunit
VKQLWIILAFVTTFGFTVLGWVGSRIDQERPPIPERIVTSDGHVVVPDGSIRSGQAVWQTFGGMEVGSIWGHGSYVAPDWTADWLHRELRMPGDTLFAIGAIGFVVFVFGLGSGYSVENERRSAALAADRSV